MIIKLAFAGGGKADQFLAHGLSVTDAVANLRKDKKDMHHGKAMAIGGAVGAAGLAGGGAAAATGAIKATLKHGSREQKKQLIDFLKESKSMLGKNPKAKALGILAAAGASAGILGGLHGNAKVRTAKAAARGARDDK